jgi:DNA-binding transcriptional MerR regulator
MDTKRDRYNLLKENVPVRAFSDYQLQSSYKPLRDTVNERKYRVGDTGISRRIIANWSKKKLVPEGAEASGGWRQFSLVEIAWLRAVLHLQELGLSLERIRGVKEDVLHWNKKTKCYPYFEFCIAQALVEAEVYLLVSAGSPARLLFAEEIEMGKILGLYKHISLISLRAILSELNQNVAEKKKWFGLSDNEIKMLLEIRKGGEKEIKLRVKDRSAKIKKIIEIESTKVYAENPSFYEIHKGLMQEGAFAEVSTSFENGKEQSVEVLKKKCPKQAIS